MRDFSRGTAWLSINQATTRSQWTLEQAIAGYARHGVQGIAVWRDKLAECGVKTAAAALKAAGMTVTGLCRGGLFPASDKAGLQAAIDENKRAVDEAAAIGAQCLVLIAGGLAKGSKDIAGARGQVRDGIAALLPYARAAKVPLAIEPLHPMYAADRACLNTMAQANDLCDELGEGLGIAVDVYHVWWDPDLEREIRRAGKARILGFPCLRLAGADHRPAARPRHDGRRRDRHPAGSAAGSRRPGMTALPRSRSSRPTTGGSAIRTRSCAPASSVTAACAETLPCRRGA